MKSLRAICLGVCMLIAAGAAAQTPVKVGYTCIELIFTYLPEAKAMEKEIETAGMQYQKSLQIKQKNLEAEYIDYQEKVEANMLSPEQRKATEDKLKKLNEELENDKQNAQLAMLKKREELIAPITEKLQKAIDEVAKENGFTYIINNVVGSGTPTILYGVDGMEVTLLIAKKLGITLPAEDAGGN